jgi:hypothetical protein
MTGKMSRDMAISINLYVTFPSFGSGYLRRFARAENKLIFWFDTLYKPLL